MFIRNLIVKFILFQKRFFLFLWRNWEFVNSLVPLVPLLFGFWFDWGCLFFGSQVVVLIDLDWFGWPCGCSFSLGTQCPKVFFWKRKQYNKIRQSDKKHWWKNWNLLTSENLLPLSIMKAGWQLWDRLITHFLCRRNSATWIT